MLALTGAKMIKVEINTSDLQQVMRSMPSAMKLVMEDALDYAGNKFMKTWHAERFQGGEGIQEHDRRHGIFSRFKKTVISEKGDMALKIAANNRVAAKLETGYTVQGSPGHRIPVPLESRPELFTSTGALKRNYRRASGFAKLVPILFKGQFYYTKIKRARGKRTKDELTPLFVLKNKVTVKPRLGFYSTFERMQPTLWNLLATRLIRAVKAEWSKGEVSFSV